MEENIKKRVLWIQSVLKEASAEGIVLGMSGGKDCALVAILAKMATENATGLIMPCEMNLDIKEDKEDVLALAEKIHIDILDVDLTKVKKAFIETLYPISKKQSEMAYANIDPRLRMIALYNFAQRNNYLVAGTSNLSERTMGYFTKWGDGAYDFNPIADLTAGEIYKILEFLDCPPSIIQKAPSAGLREGQTDEDDFGITYAQLDRYILTGEANEEVKNIVDSAFNKTEHKRKMPRIFPN